MAVVVQQGVPCVLYLESTDLAVLDENDDSEEQNAAEEHSDRDGAHGVNKYRMGHTDR